jgi:uncharacterized protein
MKLRMGQLVFTFVAALLAAVPALAQSGGTAPATTSPAATPASNSPAQAAADASAAKLDPAKEAAIRHLMDITETTKLGENLQVYITDRVHEVAGRAIAADRLQKFMATFSEKFNASTPPSAVTDAVVRIYARNFSMEDIQGLIQFYESPLGKRVVKTLPEISAESQKVGLDMDQNAALAVLRGMSEEYAEIKPMLPAEDAKPAGSAPASNAAPAPSAAPAPKLAPAPKSSLTPGTPANPKSAPQN